MGCRSSVDPLSRGKLLKDTLFPLKKPKAHVSTDFWRPIWRPIGLFENICLPSCPCVLMCMLLANWPTPHPVPSPYPQTLKLFTCLFFFFIVFVKWSIICDDQCDQKNERFWNVFGKENWDLILTHTKTLINSKICSA